MAKKVTIYSTEFCIWCRRTKEFFKENNIKYKDIDVGKNVKAAQEMIKKSGQQGVPVIDIDGNLIIGFDRPKVNKFLGL